ncbi:HEAT repeat domain-containing protein [Methanoculleus chikugoensis]|uniref:HEAT repeat domain-containing protein n=1 Tax=Methanoculleus chikugoensis TaxID=118126 RepID=UPI001FB436B9|nr:HEAT repeat domain-containing protein [Methanoculleus chikugoensis]
MAGRDPPVPERETEGLEREKKLHRYLSMLASGNLNERWRAADALGGELGDSRAVRPLIEALEDEYVDVRWKAAKALGLLDGREPVLPLIRSLEDDSPLGSDGGGSLGARGGDRRSPGGRAVDPAA